MIEVQANREPTPHVAIVVDGVPYKHECNTFEQALALGESTSKALGLNWYSSRMEKRYDDA